MSNILIGLMTHPDRLQLEQLIQSAVEKKLIACGNILPSALTSLYTWEGKIHRNQESLVIFKTTPEKSDACIHFFQAAHPYTCPEILFLPVASGFPDYLKWVTDVCNTPSH